VNNADFIIPVEIDGTVHQVKPAWHSCYEKDLHSCYLPTADSISLGCIAECSRWRLPFKGFLDGCLERDDMAMGLGLIQVIQDRFVQTSTACSG